jgi:hypothetical protein
MCPSMDQVDAMRPEPLLTRRETPTITAHLPGSQAVASSSAQQELRECAGPADRPQHDASRLQRMEGAAAAFLLSGLAPSLVMTAVWHDARLAPLVFAFTLMVALSLAVMIGVPLFLIGLWRRWISVGSCVLLGAMIGAAPAAILTYQTQRPGFHAGAWMDGVSAVASEAVRSAIWMGYIKPLMYCGLLGALGGLVFWAVLMGSGGFGRRSG